MPDAIENQSTPAPESRRADFPFRPSRLSGERQLMVNAWCVAGALATFTVIGIVSQGLFAFYALAMLLLALAMGYGYFRRRLVRRALDPHDGMVCPVCLFSLKGLGVEGVCPECGLHYTRPRIIALWESAYGIKGRFQKVLPPPEPEKSPDRPKKAPWSSWSFAAATEHIERIARAHGFSGGRFQSYLMDFDKVSTIKAQALPGELFGLLQWLDSGMWLRFTQTNCKDDETLPLQTVSIDALWEDSQSELKPEALPPISLFGPLELQAFKLAQLAAERCELKEFEQARESQGRDSSWIDCQIVPFAVTSSGTTLYVVTGASDLHRGAIVTFSSGCRDRIWLADSLGQWILRMADCDGMDVSLFPHTREKVAAELLNFHDEEFVLKNPNLNEEGLRKFGVKPQAASAQ